MRGGGDGFSGRRRRLAGGAIAKVKWGSNLRAGNGGLCVQACRAMQLVSGRRQENELLAPAGAGDLVGSVEESTTAAGAEILYTFSASAAIIKRLFVTGASERGKSEFGTSERGTSERGTSERRIGRHCVIAWA